MGAADDRKDALAELARKAGSGDRAATAQLLRALGPSLLRSLRRMTGSTDVDDLLQESMIALVAALRDFRGESSVERYATRIAVRTAIGLRRRARERRTLLDDHVRASEPLGDDSSRPADQEALAERRRALLRDLLTELPEPQAEALAMRVVLEHSLEEIAEATHAPVNTIRSRIRLAREALRARIEGDPKLSRMLEVAEE
jgi:RNA polymerase sigma-70 factor (ECF subfamily)